MVEIKPDDFLPGSIDEDEFGRLDGVLQNIQSRIDTFLCRDGSRPLTNHWTITQDISATKFSANSCIFNGTSVDAKMRAGELNIGGAKIHHSMDSDSKIVFEFTPVDGVGGLLIEPTYDTGANVNVKFPSSYDGAALHQFHLFGVRQKAGVSDLGNVYINQWPPASNTAGWVFVAGDNSLTLNHPTNTDAVVLQTAVGRTGDLLDAWLMTSRIFRVDKDGNIRVNAFYSNSIVYCESGSVFIVDGDSGILGPTTFTARNVTDTGTWTITIRAGVLVASSYEDDPPDP